MAVDFKHIEFIGGYSLIFEAFTTDVDQVIADRGFSPMGYFWEQVAHFLHETDRVEGPFSFDCSADWFSVNGSYESTSALLRELERLTSEPAAITALIDEAQDEDFELEF